jgi:hypothetical protein
MLYFQYIFIDKTSAAAEIQTFLKNPSHVKIEDIKEINT